MSLWWCKTVNILQEKYFFRKYEQKYVIKKQNMNAGRVNLKFYMKKKHMNPRKKSQNVFLLFQPFMVKI